MPRLDKERRRAARYRFVAHVRLEDGSMGQTVDMSTCGLFFETDRSYAVGETIRFSVILDESTVQCQGRVVRVDQREGRFGIAVELELCGFA